MMAFTFREVLVWMAVLVIVFVFAVSTLPQDGHCDFAPSITPEEMEEIDRQIQQQRFG